MYYSDYYNGYYNDEPRSASYNAVLGPPQFSEEDSVEPISLEVAKNWLKVDSVQDDIKITHLIKAARGVCEKYINQSLINRTVTATLNNTSGNIFLPYGPVKSVTSITNSNSTALVTGQYSMFGSGFVRLQWPCEDNIKIVYTAGYGENCIPPQAEIGILNQLAYMYEHPGDDEAMKSQISPMAKANLKSLKM